MLAPFLLPALLAIQAPPAARPAWVEQLPEMPGRLYAVGTADLGPQVGRSILRASDRARLEVVARLRATVQGRTSTTTWTQEWAGKGRERMPAETGGRITHDDVSIGVRAVDLPGLGVEQTYSDASANTVYALAYLDLTLARTSMAARLETIRRARLRLGNEASRKVLWRLRCLSVELDHLEETVGLLAVAGADLHPALDRERQAIDQRLERLNPSRLPPLDLAATAVAVRSNARLPPGVEAFLRAEVASHGLLARDLQPDVVLDVTFAAGDSGRPEFIQEDMDPFRGVTYRLDANLTLNEPGGMPLTRSVPILLVQGNSPEGMADQFRKQIERWLPRLFADLKGSLP